MLVALHILLGKPPHEFPLQLQQHKIDSFHYSLFQWMLLGEIPDLSTLPSIAPDMTPPSLLPSFQGACLTCPSARSLLSSTPRTQWTHTPDLFTPASSLPSLPQYSDRTRQSHILTPPDKRTSPLSPAQPHRGRPKSRPPCAPQGRSHPYPPPVGCRPAASRAPRRPP